MQRWTHHFRHEVQTHFRQAAATLLGPTVIDPQQHDIVSWALKEALCVLGPGLLLDTGIRSARHCPLPELCGDPNPPPVVAQFTLEFVAAQRQRHREHRARQLRQREERVVAVARRLWARVVTAAHEQPHDGSNAVAVVVLLRGISLMFRVLRNAGAASDASNLAGGTLDDGGLDAFDDRFTSCLLNHPNTTAVIAAVHCLATWVPVFHLLPLGPAPEDVSRSRTYQQLRLLFHGAADSRIRSAVLHILVRLECPGLVQDLLERCAQETDTEVLTQLYHNGQAMVSQESFHLIESVVDVAQRGLNHYDKRVVAAAISTVVCVMMAHYQRQDRSEDVDKLCCMIARAVSRLEMISEPGVESLLRLTAARIAAYEHHHHQSNGALLERLPQELKDLIGECRASRQQNQNVGAYKARSITSKLPAHQPLWRALSQVAASQLVPECSWQLRESGLLLLEVMGQVWEWKNSEMQAFVEEHWAFLVATLNDPVAQVRLRCCDTITQLLANGLPSKQDHDRLSRLVDEGLLVLLSSELSRGSPARVPTAAADAPQVFVQALALLRQLAANETQCTEAAVQRAFVGYLACIAHIPLNRQPDVMERVLEWFKRDKAPRAKLACAALVTMIEEHLRSHDLRAICAGLTFLVALWPHFDVDSRSCVVQCTVRVLDARGFPDEVQHQSNIIISNRYHHK
ncbi:HEAT repeat domain containing protein [Acanthamoeba castellanii str. Neff]|uniref:HEAT repeat domain containing protein n=1 Tax=Acanthamoeba castellanii (strain ATCC 30010 / Neff) TaxID=1257118 RepID=L8H3T5_ACACF|nr:HEAT repeat domain containing protein [Acanthamoeba castellanii str. Neff]ELR19398.1 HEAT repeat domain containing protein [Acanthamoeba castellanii str. Neff]